MKIKPHFWVLVPGTILYVWWLANNDPRSIRAISIPEHVDELTMMQVEILKATGFYLAFLVVVFGHLFSTSSPDAKND